MSMIYIRLKCSKCTGQEFIGAGSISFSRCSGSLWSLRQNGVLCGSIQKAFSVLLVMGATVYYAIPQIRTTRSGTVAQLFKPGIFTPWIRPKHFGSLVFNIPHENPDKKSACRVPLGIYARPANIKIMPY